MRNWVEFEVPVDCPVCGLSTMEHMEFDIQNRTYFLETEKRKTKCDNCEHEFSYKGVMNIDTESQTQDEP